MLLFGVESALLGGGRSESLACLTILSNALGHTERHVALTCATSVSLSRIMGYVTHHHDRPDTDDRLLGLRAAYLACRNDFMPCPLVCVALLPSGEEGVGL